MATNPVFREELAKLTQAQTAAVGSDGPIPSPTRAAYCQGNFPHPVFGRDILLGYVHSSLQAYVPRVPPAPSTGYTHGSYFEPQSPFAREEAIFGLEILSGLGDVSLACVDHLSELEMVSLEYNVNSSTPSDWAEAVSASAVSRGLLAEIEQVRGWGPTVTLSDPPIDQPTSRIRVFFLYPDASSVFMISAPFVSNEDVEAIEGQIKPHVESALGTELQLASYHVQYLPRNDPQSLGIELTYLTNPPLNVANSASISEALVDAINGVSSTQTYQLHRSTYVRTPLSGFIAGVRLSLQSFPGVGEVLVTNDRVLIIYHTAQQSQGPNP